MAPRVLVVEDDRRTAAFLDRALSRHGYSVRVAFDGPTALSMATADPPDVVVLDRMLPGLDGLEVARSLRTVATVPILMLTARHGVGDRIAGLDAGADDYLVKPFDVDELLARVRAQLRRQALDAAGARSGALIYRDVRADLDAREAFREQRRLQLRPTTFDLLVYFMRFPERALSRQELLTNVWGYEHMGTSNPVDVRVLDLRRHLELTGEPRLIHTVRGAGYMLAPPLDAPDSACEHG
jgi:two-component system response regulator MprA